MPLEEERKFCKTFRGFRVFVFRYRTKTKKGGIGVKVSKHVVSQFKLH